MRRRRLPLLVIIGLLGATLALGTASSSSAATRRPAPNYSLRVIPSTVSLNAGGEASIAITVARSSTFRSRIGLQLAGLPVGVAVVSSAATRTGVNVVLSAPAGARTSSSTLRLVGSGGGLAREARFTLQLNGAAAPPVTAPPVTAPPRPTTPATVGDFSLSVDPAIVTVQAGAATRFAVFLNPTGGFNSTVRFQLKGLPAGAQAAFLPEFSKQGTTLVISTASTMVQGDYLLGVEAVDGARVRGVNFNFAVRTGSDFTINVVSSVATVVAGASTTLTVNVMSLTSVPANVALTVAGLPVGASLSPATAQTNQTAFFQVTFPTTVAAGFYRITVNGVSGSFVRSAFVDINVNPTLSLALSPTGASAPRGSTTTYALQYVASPGLAAPVFTVTSRPPDSTVAIIINADGTRFVTVTTAATTPLGTHTVQVQAQVGTVLVTSAASLTVT